MIEIGNLYEIYHRTKRCIYTVYQVPKFGSIRYPSSGRSENKCFA